MGFNSGFKGLIANSCNLRTPENFQPCLLRHRALHNCGNICVLFRNKKIKTSHMMYTCLIFSLANLIKLICQETCEIL